MAALPSLLAQLKSLRPEYNPSGQLAECTFLKLHGIKSKQFPLSVFYLTQLRDLIVTNSDISMIPEDMSRLVALTSLVLHTNKLSDLPQSISVLSNLRVLIIAKNEYTEIPAAIFSLVGITYLNISSNRITSLPPNISLLSELVRLDIYANQISELPTEITVLKQLLDLCIQNVHDGTTHVKKAPCTISTLPCWTNMTNPTGGSPISDSLRLLRSNSTRPLYRSANRSPHPERAHSSSTGASGPASPSPTVEHSHNTLESTQIAQSQFAVSLNFESGNKDSDPITGDFADVMQVKFREQEVLGEGGFGTSYKVHLRKGIVALKVMKTMACPGTPEYEKLTHEAKLLIKLNHENIIKIHAHGCKNGKVFYIMEYADGGSLWDVIQKSGPLPFDNYMAYSIDICSGLQYLHTREPPVQHRDLKPENVLLSNGRAKICDFGTSVAREPVSQTTAFKGTFNYAPPEYFDSGKGYGPMGDIYSFGLTVWTMISGTRPYDGMNHGQIMSSILAKSLPEMPSSCPASLGSVLKICWDHYPYVRPTSDKLVVILNKIRMNPNEAVCTSENFQKMNSARLADFLRTRKVIPNFIATAMDNTVNGAYFITLTEPDLIDEPFNLSTFQARVILKIIAEFK